MSLPTGFKKVNVLKSADEAPKESAPKESTLPKDDAPIAPKKGITSIADSLLSDMSEVQEHVVEAHTKLEEEKEEAKRAEFADLVDKNGDPFDPAKHRTKKNGDPYISPRGKLILDGKKLRGESDSFVKSNKAQTIDPAEQAKSHKIRATATLASTTLVTIGYAIGGEEWKPRVDAEIGLNELDMLTDAFATYLEAHEIEEIPPSLGLAVAVSAYAVPRFSMPKTQSRLSKVKNWFARKYADYKLKKYGGKVVKREN